MHPNYACAVRLPHGKGHAQPNSFPTFNSGSPVLDFGVPDIAGGVPGRHVTIGWSGHSHGTAAACVGLGPRPCTWRHMGALTDVMGLGATHMAHVTISLITWTAGHPLWHASLGGG